MKKRFRLFIITAVWASGFLFTSEWPQYLGPDRNAVSAEKGLIRSWPAEGPKVLWTVPLGEGFGGPAVSKGKVYVFDRVDDKFNILRCININDGKQEWTFQHEAPGAISHNGSRTVPTIDNNRIYFCGPFGNLHCLDINSRKVLWQKNIWTDFGGKDLPRWAIAQHPLIYKDTVIVASQTDEAGVVAYDKVNGSLRWKTAKLPGQAGYVTPRIIKVSKRDHLVMITSLGAVMGMDPGNGRPLWSYDSWKCSIAVPNVTEVGDNRIFITGGYKAGSALIKIKTGPEGYTIEEIFRIKEFSTHVHPPVLYKGHLYGLCSTNETKDGMVCMDLKGNIKWKTKRDPFFDKGGFILVDKMIVCVDGTKGNLYLIDPTPDGFKPLAKAKLLDTQKCWAPLALSNGKLLIRDLKQMRCVLLK